MTYTAIPDANIASGKPIREVDGLLLRDNPIAMMNGDSGAPPLQDAALYTGTASTARNTWIRNGYALSSLGVKGMLGFFQTDSASLDPGDTVSGSSLSYSGVLDDGNGTVIAGTSPSGTWMCLGYTRNGVSSGAATLFFRIA